jgi:type IV pilus assembly protein PilC
MPRFSYKGRDGKGETMTGFIDAPSRPDAVRQLQRDGGVVTSIALARPKVDEEAIKTTMAARNIKRDEVISFAGQLSVMLDTGVPLSHAMDAFVEQSKRSKSGLGRIAAEVSSSVAGGASFSEAIARFPKVFPSLMVSLMQASEASGSMADMLNRVSTYLGEERKTAKQIKGALTYPAVMLGLAAVITGFLVVWVLPKFAKIYANREGALPPLTKVVLGVSEFATGQWWKILLGLGAAVGVFLAMRATGPGRRLLDTFKVKAPVIGPMFRMFYLTRASRTLGTLLASGVNVLDAVRIVRGVTQNVLWHDLWDRVEEAITQGRPISEEMLATDLVPPPAAQMIASGENAGKLPRVLDRIAQSAQDDFDNAVKQATQLIEPAMIVIMGGTIGTVAIALLLPIFSISNTM